MTICIIGDIHGKIDDYTAIVEREECTLQLGDFGVGPAPGWVNEPPYFGESHRAFRGNHDSPLIAAESPIFLPDYGYWNKIFYMAGADSIDKQHRTAGHSWWENEELSMGELTNAIGFYEDTKPQVVVTHCPQSIFEEYMQPRVLDRSRTRMALQAMLDAHRPRLWIYGHHHVSMTIPTETTLFMCLKELETCEVEINRV